MSNKVGVGVGVFVWRNGKFLMGQRKGSHGEGTWSVPGGWQEHSESWETAAKREVMEETGMNIENVRFVTATDNYFPEEDVHSVTIWLDADWTEGEPQLLEPDKFVNQEWRDFQSLPEPLFEPCWTELRKMRPDLFLADTSQQG
jgi:8-oxo-dGTP diphosphatase